MLPKLTEFLNAGMSLVEDICEDDGSVNVDIVVSLLRKRAAGWNPTYNGHLVFDENDPGTKEAGIRFLAGLAVRAAGKTVSNTFKSNSKTSHTTNAGA